MIASTEALINGWLDFASDDGLEFQASPADNYDVFVFQLTFFKDTKKLEGLLSALQKLVQLRQSIQPVKVVLWGSPITTDPTANITQSLIEQTIHEAFSERHLSSFWDNAIFVDVTDSTRQAVTRGFGHLTDHSAQHFGDFTRLMIADNILNAIKLLLIE